MTAGEWAFVFGSGLGAVTIFFPIIYLAFVGTHKRKLPLGRVVLLALACAPVVGFLQPFAAALWGNTDAAKFITFFAVPLIVSTVVLHLAYRGPRELPKVSPSANLSPPAVTPLAEADAPDPAVAVPGPASSTGSSRERGAANPREAVAFRLMLLAWALGLVLIAIAIGCHFKAESARGVALQAAVAQVICVDESRPRVAACNSLDGDAREKCHSSMNDRCRTYTQAIKVANAESDDWERTQNHFVLAALAICALSAMAFYGGRWALTGRFTPLWVIR